MRTAARKGARQMRAALDIGLKDWLALALLGLGVSFPPHQFIGGLFLALAGAAFARSMQPTTGWLDLLWTSVGAFLVATVGSVIVYAYRPDFPPQIVMAILGYASRYIARAGLAFAGRLEERSGTAFDRLLDRWLPPRNGGDGQ